MTSNRYDLGEFICIKYFIHKDKSTRETKCYLYKGEFYNIQHIERLPYSNVFVFYKEKKLCLIRDVEDFKIDEYFITLPEWRNKQIDSILNDGDIS